MGKAIERMEPYTRALNKSHLIAAGFSYEELSKPIIAVANSWNEFNHGHTMHRELGERIKAGILAAGGLPIEFHAPGPCDGLAVGNPGMRFILPTRDLITDVIEATVGAHPVFDGIVYISSCDKITPGMLKAASRLDMPGIQVAGGPSVPAITFAESRRLRKAFLAGEIEEEQLSKGNALLYATPGNCAYIGTANTMIIAAEALGMALPGSAVAPAISNRRRVYCEETGRQAVRLTEMDLRPSQILTRKAFENALRVVASLGGSSNYVLHMLAIAKAAGVDLTIEDINRINQTTPLLAALAPNGPQSVVELDRAGGVPAVMRELKSLLHLDVMTITGKKVGELLEDAPEADHAVVASFEEPLGKEGGIVILHGNIAPDGAVVKRSAVPEDMYQFRGPAKVFTSEADAIQYIRQDKAQDGQILVVAYEGPKGGPGMREMHRLSGVVKASSKRIGVVTDGRFSGADSGMMVGYITPEAADGGPIGVIKDGDPIKIDLVAGTLDLDLPEDELRKRLGDFMPLEKDVKSILLNRYRNTVGPAAEGAICC